ncbi:MAG TPA: hypothetical protein VM121_08415 [Acidimicrobiales bacterium]|nr:hypothetical protein [Acidimicrobiales bacterium]
MTRTTTTIALIGANGHVATEVSLLLDRMDGVTAVPVCRSRLGAAFLEGCGLECRVGGLDAPSSSRQLLAGCDLVADFSLPAGLRADARRDTRLTLANGMAHAPPGTPYVYMSSTMAFGMSSRDQGYRKRTVSRTRYAADKRHGERRALLFGLQHHRPVYVLRLGQVHGDLQSVSRQMMAAASSGTLVGPFATGPVIDAVFCATIARALVRIAQREVAPGRYTVVDSPEWAAGSLFGYYAARAGGASDIAPDDKVGAPGPGHLARRLITWSARRLAARKEVLTAHLPLPASAERRLTTWYLTDGARAQVAAIENRSNPALVVRAGPAPGRRLPQFSGDAEIGRTSTEEVRRLLDARLGPDSHVFPSDSVARS